MSEANRIRQDELRQERLACAQNPKAKVFLTGDFGKLGSHMAKTLMHEYAIVGFDLKHGEDLANYDQLRERMKGCTYVIHTAAIPHPGAAIEAYFRVNVVGTLNVLRAAEANGVKRVVYTSSTGYYGCDIKGKLWPRYLPIDEQHPIASIEGQSEGVLDAYNQSKVMAEQLLAYYGTNRRFEVVVLRLAPANTKGQSYPDFNWKACTDYRRGCFFTTCHPQSVANAAKLAIEAAGPFWYEAFNITDKYMHGSVNVREFLAQEYPEVELRVEVTDHMCLISCDKAIRVLGYRPNEDLY